MSLPMGWHGCIFLNLQRILGDLPWLDLVTLLLLAMPLSAVPRQPQKASVRE